MRVMPETALTLVQFLRDGVDPVPELAQLRAQHPVSPLLIPGGPTAWLVTGYSETRAVLGDHNTFSNDFARVAEAGGPGQDKDPGGLGFADPPVHTRLRRMLTGEFTAHRLRELEPGIAAVIEECLDGTAAASVPDGEPVDLVRTFARSGRTATS
jgi:cytochrome P450